MNRRSFLKYIVGGLFSFIGISGGTYYYAREIEPKSLEINTLNISSKKIPHSFNHLKIVQFSDTHVGFHYTLAQLKKLIKKINQLQPDIIVFTGDLIDAPNQYNENTQLSEALLELNAPHGKYWVYGNHDHGGYGTDLIESIMRNANFTLLQNSCESIQIDNQAITLAGIDDAILGSPDLHTTLDKVDPSQFTILLSHEPDIADTTINFPVDVQLSGHSHGGQVRLPIIGHIYTPEIGRAHV